MGFEDWISIGGALVVGLAFGWLLHDWSARRSARPAVSAGRPVRPALQSAAASRHPARPSKPQALGKQTRKVEVTLAERQRAVERHQAELVKVNADLTLHDRELEALRNRLEKRDREHARLLQEVGERRARMAEVGADLYRLNQELIRQEEKLEELMKRVAERGHELEVLEQLDAGYQAEIDELTQDVQQLDGEDARLKSVIEARQRDLDEARALLVQREAELAGVIHSRERTEYDIELAYEQMELIGGEHKRLMARLGEAEAQANARARMLHAFGERKLIEAQAEPIPAPEPEPEWEPEPLPGLEPEAEVETGPFPEPESEAEVEPDPLPEPETEAEAEPDPLPEPELEAEAESEPSLEPVSEPEPPQAAPDSPNGAATHSLPAQTEPVEDDLTRIKGVGPGYASLLKAAGITTYGQLSEMPVEELRDLTKASRLANVEAWIAEARALAAERELGRLQDTGQRGESPAEDGDDGDGNLVMDDFFEDDEDDVLIAGYFDEDDDAWLDELLED